MKKLYSVFCLLMLSVTLLGASNRTKVIEAMADAEGEEQKWEALSSIESILEDGSAGEDMPELIRILGNLSAEGTTRVRMDGGFVTNDYPRIRLEAVRLLGLTESPEALGPLIAVLRNDMDFDVLSLAALTSAGLVQADWNSLVPYYFQILKMKKEVYRQERLIRDVLRSIRIIYDRDETILQNGKIIEGILFIAETELGFSRETREQALNLKKDI
jgi:hypothetical protein